MNYVTISNVVSSMSAFRILPGRELYPDDRSYTSDIDYMLIGKKACLLHAWGLVDLIFDDSCREIIYAKLDTLDKRLISIVVQVIPPTFYDFVALAVATGTPMDSSLTVASVSDLYHDMRYNEAKNVIMCMVCMQGP